MNKLKNLTSIFLATCLSATATNCSYVASLKKTREKEAPSLVYIYINDRTKVKEFFGYTHYTLDFKVEVSYDGKELYAYTTDQKRSDVPLYKTQKNKVVNRIYLTDVDFDGDFDIVLTEKIFVNRLYTPHFLHIEKIEPSDWRKKQSIITALSALIEQKAKVFLNVRNGTFNRIPISIEKILNTSSDLII